MYRLASTLICALVSIGMVQAANVAWVTDYPADNLAPGTNAGGVPFSQAPDKGYTDALSTAGHMVTRIESGPLNTTPAIIASLNGYDVVIIGRGNRSSGGFGTNKDAWNSVTAPMILMNGYIERSSRLGYATTTTIPDVQVPVLNPSPDPTPYSLDLEAPSHPIFAGIGHDASGLMNSPYGYQLYQLNDTGTLQIQSGPSTVVDVNAVPPGETTTTLATGGTTLARVVGITTSAANGGTLIAEFPAGTIPAGGGAAFGAERLLFLSGTREAGGNNAPGFYDLAPDGERMFLNAVNYMATIPEPSTVILLGIGVLALRMRQRK